MPVVREQKRDERKTSQQVVCPSDAHRASLCLLVLLLVFSLPLFLSYLCLALPVHLLVRAPVCTPEGSFRASSFLSSVQSSRLLSPPLLILLHGSCLSLLGKPIDRPALFLSATFALFAYGYSTLKPSPRTSTAFPRGVTAGKHRHKHLVCLLSLCAPFLRHPDTHIYRAMCLDSQS